ncbi:FAD-binding protein [Desulfocicer vacuolatum]|nr:FAD-binding protein [Desulfocicer vacuolatum]
MAEKEIWVYGDVRSSALFNNSLNVLAGAQKLASLTGGKTVFMIISRDNKHNPDAVEEQNAADQAVKHGVDRVLTLKPSAGGYLLPEQEARIIAGVVQQQNPCVCLFPLHVIPREICSRVATLCHGGMIADCMDFKYDAGEIIAVCPSHGGEVMAQLGFSDATITGFITVQPNAFVRKETTSAQGELETLTVTSLAPCDEISFLSCDKESRSEKNLETARKIVVGGAGLGNIENFTTLRKLSAALGAETGATRPPVLWHWIDEERLIGQTGKTVSPELLISLGTSGAVQYTAGITGAKTVVAVNKDPNAPIFQFADMGIVGDVNLFLPVFTEKIKQISLRSLADALDTDGPSARGDDFGSRLIRIRRAHGLTREVLAQSVGRTPEFIKELENNQTTASVGLLITLAEVFDIDAGTFLNAEEQSKLAGERAQAYTRRTANYHYQSLTPGAENEHLRVFMITIESRQKHKPVDYRHEGEEFVYVMDGQLGLTLDGKLYTLMKGEYMKYNSQTPHQLKSLSDEKTRCLVTLYTP